MIWIGQKRRFSFLLGHDSIHKECGPLNDGGGFFLAALQLLNNSGRIFFDRPTQGLGKKGLNTSLTFPMITTCLVSYIMSETLQHHEFASVVMLQDGLDSEELFESGLRGLFEKIQKQKQKEEREARKKEAEETRKKQSEEMDKMRARAVLAKMAKNNPRITGILMRRQGSVESQKQEEELVQSQRRKSAESQVHNEFFIKSLFVDSMIMLRSSGEQTMTIICSTRGQHSHHTVNGDVYLLCTSPVTIFCCTMFGCS